MPLETVTKLARNIRQYISRMSPPQKMRVARALELILQYIPSEVGILDAANTQWVPPDASNISQNKSRLFYLKGEIYHLLGMLALALKNFKAAYEAGWESPELFNQVSHLLVVAKRYDQAIDFLDRGLKLYPEDPGKRNGLIDRRSCIMFERAAAMGGENSRLFFPNEVDLNADDTVTIEYPVEDFKTMLDGWEEIALLRHHAEVYEEYFKCSHVIPEDLLWNLIGLVKVRQFYKLFRYLTIGLDNDLKIRIFFGQILSLCSTNAYAQKFQRLTLERLKREYAEYENEHRLNVKRGPFASYDCKILAPTSFEDFACRIGAPVKRVSIDPIKIDKPVMLGANRSISHEKWQSEKGLMLLEGADMEVIVSGHELGFCRPMSCDKYLFERPYEGLYVPGAGLHPIERARGAWRKDSFALLNRAWFGREEISTPCVYLGGTRNFGHFVHDLLPKILSLEAHGIGSDIPILTCFLNDDIRAILGMFFPDRTFIDLADGPEFSSGNWIWKNKKRGIIYRLRDTTLPSRVSYSYAHPLLQERTAAWLRSRGEYSSKRRRFYLSRRDQSGGRRRVDNEEELLAALKNHGFEEICPPLMDVQELAKVINQAEIVVSSIGSQDSALIFCRPDVRWLELWPQSRRGEHTYNLQSSMFYYSTADHRRVYGTDLRHVYDQTIAIFDVEEIMGVVTDMLGEQQSQQKSA